MADPDDLELTAGVRFVHACEVQGRSEMRRLRITIDALAQTLLDKKLIDPGELEDARGASRTRIDEQNRAATFPVAAPESGLEPVTIPCEENLATCKAACCRLLFPLTTREVADGRIRWSYQAPYLIRQEAGRCVHNDARGRCDSYAARPGFCRTYDCRNDARIWKDYATRTPSDEVAALPPREAP